MGLYENIKKAADKQGYSINRLEKEMELPRSSISKYNKNSPSVDKIQKIADFLSVSVDYLMKGTEAEPNSDTPYYINEDARDMAQFMFDHPEYKVLFDASRKVNKEDIEFVKEMIERFSGNNK